MNATPTTLLRTAAGVRGEESEVMGQESRNAPGSILTPDSRFLTSSAGPDARAASFAEFSVGMGDSDAPGGRRAVGLRGSGGRIGKRAGRRHGQHPQPHHTMNAIPDYLRTIRAIPGIVTSVRSKKTGARSRTRSRESIISAADIALIRDVPAASLLPDKLRRQIIGSVLDGLMKQAE